MLKELFATCLLLYGCSSRGISNVYADSNDSNDNNIVERISEPQYANTFNNRVTGLYNFRDRINFYDWFNDAPQYYSVTITFDEEELGLCPISLGNQNNEFLISLFIELEHDATDTIYLDFYTYDMYGEHNSYEISSYEIVDIEDLTYPSLFFNYTSSLILSDYDYDIFDRILTHDDNQYIVSYTGYYNFLTNSSLRDGDKFSILGSVVYNNIICNALYFQRQGTLSYVYYVNYSVSSSSNIVSTITFEDFRSKPNLLLSGVKMEVDTYTELSTIGVFSYVRDTSYDNTDFHDLLFTIMDTPIYFFSRLFDFQFFGVNLYIALSGLITLAIVVIIIRKIW